MSESPFDQSELVAITLGMGASVEEMTQAIREYFEASGTILRHGDIEPLFEDVVAIVQGWVRDGRADLVDEFLGKLQVLLLGHPSFVIPSSVLSPEKHLLTKFSMLANILGTTLRRGVISTSK